MNDNRTTLSIYGQEVKYMFKTRFVAVLLSLTTVFAAFAAGAFAENSISVDETIVIKDGKVVSGDSSLVDQGFIVIADESSDDATEEAVSTESSELSDSMLDTEDAEGSEDRGSEESTIELDDEAKLDYNK